MAYKYKWLSLALEDLSQEIGYVYDEFGLAAARRAEVQIHDGVRQLCQFPKSGVRYDGLHYHENEVRVLHLRKVSIIYSFEDDVIILIAIWNNYQNPNRLQSVIEAR